MGNPNTCNMPGRVDGVVSCVYSLHSFETNKKISLVRYRYPSTKCWRCVAAASNRRALSATIWLRTASVHSLPTARSKLEHEGSVLLLPSHHFAPRTRYYIQRAMRHVRRLIVTTPHYVASPPTHNQRSSPRGTWCPPTIMSRPLPRARRCAGEVRPRRRHPRTNSCPPTPFRIRHRSHLKLADDWMCRAP